MVSKLNNPLKRQSNELIIAASLNIVPIDPIADCSFQLAVRALRTGLLLLVIPSYPRDLHSQSLRPLLVTILSWFSRITKLDSGNLETNLTTWRTG